MSLNKRDLVTLRAATPEDKNFILATFLRGLYYGDTWFREIPKPIFMKQYHAIATRLLSLPTVSIIIACLKEDPDTILSYAILGKNSTGSTLHWVFTKTAWRNIGIGKMLIPQDLNTVTHLSKVGLSLLRKRTGVDFNPFAVG